MITSNDLDIGARIIGGDVTAVETLVLVLLDAEFVSGRGVLFLIGGSPAAVSRPSGAIAIIELSIKVLLKLGVIVNATGIRIRLNLFCGAIYFVF